VNTRRFAGNTLFVLTARACDLVSGVVTVTLAARYLGPERFGAYAFVVTVAAAVSSFVAMGSARILVRDLAVDPDRSSSLTTSAVWLNVALGIAAVAVVHGVLWAMDMRTASALSAGAAAVLWQVLLVVRRTLIAIPLAREAMQYEALLTVATRTVQVAGFVAVVLGRLSYPWFFAAGCLAEGMGLLVALVVVVPRFASLSWRFRPAEIAYLFRESAPVAVYNFLGQSGVYVNVFFLKWLQDLTAVSLFQAPQRVIGPLTVLPMSVLLAWTPALSRMGADGSRSEELRKSCGKALQLVLLFGAPACLLATVYAQRIVGLLFGAGFLPSTPSFRILLWAIIPFSLNALLNTVLTALGRQGSVVRIHLVALAVNVLVGPWLVLAYGHVGASIALLASATALFLLNQGLLARVVGGLDMGSAIARTLLASAAMFGLFSAVRTSAGDLLAIAAAVIGYAAIAVLLRAVTPSEIRASVAKALGAWRR
jgi:O-antigen/teichoic acid export membrane protein